MGIRPRMSLIVGTYSVNSKHKKSTSKLDIWEDEIPDSLLWEDNDDFHKLYDLNMRKWGTPEFQFSCLGDIIYNPSGDDEYENKGVIGLIITKGEYDSTIFRAMAAIDSRYMVGGYSIVPDENISSWMFKRIGYTDDDKRCHRIVNTVLESMPQLSRIDWKRAVHYLKLCGWDINEDELHYILVWDWS